MIDRRIVAFLIGILLAVPTLSTSAQTPAAIPDDADLVGLQAAVWRTYLPAGAFTGQGTIDLDETSPASSTPDEVRPYLIQVVVREFDSADNAVTAYERISAGVEASMPHLFDDGTQEVISETLPDAGSRAVRIRLEHTEPGVTAWTENVIVQRDRYVFIVTATADAFAPPLSEGEPADTSLPTAEIAAAVASGEPSPDEPVFADDGTSSGGLWGFMLPAGVPLLMGLVPIGDVIISPTPGE